MNLEPSRLAADRIPSLFDTDLINQSLKKLAQYLNIDQILFEKFSNFSTDKEWVAIIQITIESLTYTAKVYYNDEDAKALLNLRFSSKEINEEMYGEMLKECINILVGHIRNILVYNNINAKLSIPLIIKKQMDLSFTKKSVFNYISTGSLADLSERKFKVDFKHELEIYDVSILPQLLEIKVNSNQDKENEVEFF